MWGCQNGTSELLRFVGLYISTVPRIATYQWSKLNLEAKRFKQSLILNIFFTFSNSFKVLSEL